MRRPALLLITAVTAVGLVWGVGALWSRSAWFLATVWQDELECAPEHRADVILDRLAGLDDEGISALVLALSSSRQGVSKAAAKAIRRQSAAWQSLPANVAAPRQGKLARALADAWPRLDSSARVVAAEIVGRFLSCGPGEGRAGDAELLTACAEVLRAGAMSHAGPHQSELRTLATRPASADSTAPVTDRKDSLKTPGLASALDAPLGRAEPKSPGHADVPAPLPPAVGAPNPLRESSVGAAKAVPIAGSTSAASNEPRQLPPVRQARLDDDPLRNETNDAGPVGAADLRQLARLLNDESPQRVAEARKDLQERGFSTLEVNLARQLAHADPAVRKKLARVLPDTVGVDAAPWLLELSRDADADVRLEAMTLLATTGDPALLDALRKLVTADPDERIQCLSSRLSRTSRSPGKTQPSRTVPTSGDSP